MREALTNVHSDSERVPGSMGDRLGKNKVRLNLVFVKGHIIWLSLASVGGLYNVYNYRQCFVNIYIYVYV